MTTQPQTNLPEPGELSLPDLPEWSKMDNLGNLVPSEIRQELQVYARAAIASDRAQRVKVEPVAVEANEGKK